jgi:hypothetical protein
MINWSEIIIHHSWSRDNMKLSDWESIRKYHMSWRFNDVIVSEKEGKALFQNGIKGIIPPWSDIGYHYGLENVKGVLEIRTGRNLNQVGAHTKGHNETAIGICCVGNFDKEQPSEGLYYSLSQLCFNLIKQFPLIQPDNIYPHNQFSYKTCPGLLFSMNRLKEYILTF